MKEGDIGGVCCTMRDKKYLQNFSRKIGMKDIIWKNQIRLKDNIKWVSKETEYRLLVLRMWYSDEILQMELLHINKYSENGSKSIVPSPMHEVMKKME